MPESAEPLAHRGPACRVGGAILDGKKRDDHPIHAESLGDLHHAIGLVLGHGEAEVAAFRRQAVLPELPLGFGDVVVERAERLDIGIAMPLDARQLLGDGRDVASTVKLQGERMHRGHDVSVSKGDVTGEKPASYVLAGLVQSSVRLNRDVARRSADEKPARISKRPASATQACGAVS